MKIATAALFLLLTLPACDLPPSQSWEAPVMSVRCSGGELKIDEEGQFIGGEDGQTFLDERLSFDSGDPGTGWRVVDQAGQSPRKPPAPDVVRRLAAMGRYRLLSKSQGPAPDWNVYVPESFSEADYKAIGDCLAAHAEELDNAMAQVRPLPKGVPDTRSGLRPRIVSVIHPASSLGWPPPAN